MTDFLPYTAAEYAPDAPATALHFQRWFENWIAAFEGAAGAPRLADLAHPTFAAGDVELLNVNGSGVQGTSSFTSAGSATGTQWLTIFSFHPMKTGGLRYSVELKKDTGTAARARVLKNGVSQGSVSQANTAFEVFTIDFTMAPGDLISVQVGCDYAIPSGGGTQSALWKNGRLCGDRRGTFRL